MIRLLDDENLPYVALTRVDWDICHRKTFDELDSIFRSCDVIMHFAAQLPSDAATTSSFFDANVRSCLLLAEWAKTRAIPLVFLSSSTVYKDPYKSKISEMDEKVVNGFGGFYGFSKLVAESIIEHYRPEGLSAIILRPSSIYGYGMPADKLIPRYLSRAQTGGCIDILEPDNQINLVHAYDVARAALSAYLRKSWGVFNIGGDSHTVLDIAETAIRICGKGIVSVADKEHDYQPFHRFDLDMSLARASFGFEPLIALDLGMNLINRDKERA